jgi:hypothetical protein
MGIVVPAAGADPLLMDELRELIKSFRSNDLLREATNPPGDPVLILEDQTVSPPTDVLEANVAEYLRSLLIARGGGAYSVPVADADGYTLVEGDIDMTGNVSIPNLDADGNIRVTDTTGGDPPLVRQILYRDGSFLMVDSYGEFDPRTGGDPLPSPSEVGQFLYSEDGSTWTVTRPMVNDDSFILFNDDDEMVTP